MKKRLKKLIKSGVVREQELSDFIKTLTKLSALGVFPNKPKKVIKLLTPKKDSEVS